MAGSITVSSITLDSDNNFSIKSNTGATLFFANTTGVDVANSFASSSITSDKILTVANTKISGNIISSQITSVANTQLTGLIQAAQIGSANATLVTSGTLPITRLPAGSVLQVVLGTAVGVTAATTAYPNSSTRATANSLSITPISASSKIFLTYSGWWYPYDSPTNNNQVGQIGAIYRNSTIITAAGGWQIQTSNADTYTFYGMQSFVALDSPSTTSAITYSLQIYAWAGNASTVTLRETGGILIAMEVAG